MYCIGVLGSFGRGFDFNIEVFCVIEFWVFLVFKLLGGVVLPFPVLLCL